MNRSIEHIELNYFHCFETECAEFASQSLNIGDRSTANYSAFSWAFCSNTLMTSLKFSWRLILMKSVRRMK